MEGIEIVITPKIIERAVFSIIIIALLVMLLVQCNNTDCSVPKNETEKTTAASTQNITNPAPVINQTNATAATETLCSNGAKDTAETDIDCGGNCPGCIEYKMCNVDKDCATSMYCYQHIKCMKPTCDDGAKNQDETNIDCGGACTATKGAYFWSSDSKCHTTKEPSGKLDITLSANTGESELSGSAILNSLTIGIENGLSKTVFLKATIYALTSNGKAVFPDQEGINKEIEIVELDSITSGGKLTKTVNFANSTRRVLAGVDSSSKYQLKVEFRDGENVLVDTKLWTHP